MWLYIVLGIAVLAVGLSAYVASKPVEFEFSKEMTMNASPSTIFAQINDLRRFNEWNPWATIEPKAKQTFEGPHSGQSSAYIWAGNSKVGSGKMTIIESTPPSLVRIRLDFYKPFPGQNIATFTLTPKGQQTTVTWKMAGRSEAAIPRIACALIGMDKMMGGMFVKGLTTLKETVESSGSA